MTSTGINQNVNGENNIFTATGTINLSQVTNQYNTASSFIELQLDNLPSQFDRTLIDTFREKVVNQRFLIFELQSGVPSNALLREVAMETHNYIIQKEHQSNRRIPILEFAGENVGDIKTILQEIAGPAIIIFPNVFRLYLENLPSIALEAINLNVYVLVKTNMLTQARRSEQIDSRFSVQVNINDLYSDIYLEKVLRNGLESLQSDYPIARTLLKKDLSGEAEFSIKCIAVELKTPVNINGFLSGLSHIKTVNNLNEVFSIIESFEDRGVEEAISTWYRNLDTYDQLLALGVTFFDGLPEDQMYEVVQQLMQIVWKEENGTALLDRNDFQNLTEFFEFSHAGAEGDQLISKFNQQRIILLRIAYKAAHPHHIRKSIHWMYDLVQKSNEKKSRPEMFSQDKDWRRLESAITVTLSDIALLDLKAVEPMMRAMAGQDDEKMHQLVAKVFARWHSLGETEKLSAIFKRWGSLGLGWVRADTLSQNYAKTDTSQGRLLATLVLTATYAAQNDPTGGIAPELIEALSNLAQFGNERKVQAYFIKYTIPKLIPLHTYQIEPVLTNLLRHNSSFTQPISKALVSTYEHYPNEVNSILDEWYRKGRILINAAVENSNKIFGERLFAAIAITLGELANSSLLAAREIRSPWNKLQEINSLEVTAETRRTVWKNQIILSCLSPEYLRRFLANVEAKDQPQLLSLLTEIYIEQRCNVEGPSDGTYRLNGKKIPYILFEDQPLTKLDEGLKYLLINSKSEDEKVIAIQAYRAFAEQLDIRLDKHIIEERNKKITAAAQPIIIASPMQPYTQEVAPQIPYHRYDFFIDEVIPVLATINNPELELLIKEILLKIDIQRDSNYQGLDFVVSKFQIAQDQKLKAIGKCLYKALVEIRTSNQRKIIYRLRNYFTIPPKRRPCSLFRFLFS